MKICVGIPSYNEVDRISFVISQIDKGLSLLQRKYSQIEGVIVNADNCSSDNTADRFINTYTSFRKESIFTSGHPGKGKNVQAILQYAVDKNFDVILTIDADLESITPEWVVKFSEPIIKEEADFVYPEYKRDRFEGSTTNHFAYPLLFAYFGRNMRQPIGGDFAMSLRYARHILMQKISGWTLKYGIDIFMSMNAAGGGFMIDSAKLGQKIHKPSFPRMREMFPQIASSAIKTMRLYPRSSAFELENNTNINIINKTKFTHNEEADNICHEEIHNLVLMLNRKPAWLEKKKNNELKYLFPSGYQKFDANKWISILGDWAWFAIKNPNIDCDQYAAELLPFFVIRAVNFWHDSEKKSARWVEMEVRRQARALKKYLDKQ